MWSVGLKLTRLLVIRCSRLNELKKVLHLTFYFLRFSAALSLSIRHPSTESPCVHLCTRPSIFPSQPPFLPFTPSSSFFYLSRNTVTTPLPPQHPPPPTATPSTTRSHTTHHPPQRALSLTLDTHHQENFLGMLPWRLSSVQSVMMPVPSARSRLSLQEPVQSSK